MISTMRLSLNTLQLYANTWSRVLKKDNCSDEDVTEFLDQLPNLRDTLSCTVCNNLLSGSVCLTTASCDHYVCKECKGKKREDRRTCEFCIDWTKFMENESLGHLMNGYRKCCRIFLKTRKYNLLLENKHQRDSSFDAFATLDILQEGARRIHTMISTPSPPLRKLSPRSEDTRKFQHNLSSPSRSSISGNRTSSSSIMSNSTIKPSSGMNQNNCRMERVVQVIYQNKEHEDDSIDIKIEPIYQERFPNSEEPTTVEIHMDEDSEVESEQASGPSPTDPLGQDSCDMEEDDDEEIIDEDSSMDRVEVEEVDVEITETEENDIQIIPNTITPTTSNVIFQQQRLSTTIAPATLGTPTTTITASSLSSPITWQLPLHGSMMQQHTSSIPVHQNPLPSIASSPSVMHISPRQFPMHTFVLTRPSVSLSNASAVSLPSLIRLARFSLPDGRPLTMVRQVLNSSPSSNINTGMRHTITLPLSTADLLQKKIIVRPANMDSSSTGMQHATANQLQRWPDANTVLQYASGSSATLLSQQGSPFLQQTKLISNSSSFTTSSGIVLNTMAGVSNVSAASSSNNNSNSFMTMPNQTTKINLSGILSTSSGGGIVTSDNTVFTTTAREPSISSSSFSNFSGTNTTTITTSSNSSSSTESKVLESNIGGGDSMKKLKVRLPKPKNTSAKFRTGCRCGNAASQPGKLTCCGQRCPCYTVQQSCTDCKCRGCRNPHLPGGKKLMQGINAVIDTKTNQTIPLSSVSSSSTTTRISSVAISSSSPSSISNNSISNTTTLATDGGGGGHLAITPSPSPTTINMLPLPIIPSTAMTSASQQLFTRIHQPGLPQSTTATYQYQSQLIPLSNLGFTTIPISLISPANSSMQTQGETIHLQNVHHMNMNNDKSF